MTFLTSEPMGGPQENEFDAALGRDLHEVIQQTKKLASQIRQSSSDL